MPASADTIVEFLNGRTRPGVFRTQDGIRFWVCPTADGPQALLLDQHGFAEPLCFLFKLEGRPLALGRWLGDAELTTREILSVRDCQEKGILCSCPLLKIRVPTDPKFMVAICEHYFRTASDSDSIARWELTSMDGDVLFRSRELEPRS